MRLRIKEKVKRQDCKRTLSLNRKKIFDLNKKYNVETFSTAIRGRKAFATEQKL